MVQCLLRKFLAISIFLLMISPLAPVSSNAEEKPAAAQKESTLDEQQTIDVARFKKAHGLFLKYYGERRYGEAEIEVKKALGLVRTLLGNNHLITASEIHNLATLYTSTKPSPSMKKPLAKITRRWPICGGCWETIILIKRTIDPQSGIIKRHC